MFAIVLGVHVLVSALIIGLVLMQHGKGADAGAAFGSGASGTVFGASGSASFLSRSTAVLAAVFFVTSLTLAYLSGHRDGPVELIDRIVDQSAAVVAPSDMPEAATQSQELKQPVAGDLPVPVESAPATDTPPADKQ